jgi:hypothetical protein
MLGLHARGVVVATDGDADDPGLAQAMELLGDEGAILIGGRRGVEEVASIDEERGTVRDGMIYRRCEAALQPGAPLLSPPWREARQRWRQMIIARDDKTHGSVLCVTK